MITNGRKAGNGGVGDDHVLPGRPGFVHPSEVVEHVGVGVGAVHATFAVGDARVFPERRQFVASALVNVLAAARLKRKLLKLLIWIQR